jgi:hypothetical protein
MRKIRKQPREEVDAKNFINTEKALNILNKEESEESTFTPPETSLNSIVQIMKLGVTANQIKLLEAIEKEAKETNVAIPPMSTNYICAKYGINHKYLGDATKGLIEKGLIMRHPAKFRGQSSFAWEILNQ